MTDSGLQPLRAPSSAGLLRHREVNGYDLSGWNTDVYMASIP